MTGHDDRLPNTNAAGMADSDSCRHMDGKKGEMMVEVAFIESGGTVSTLVDKSRWRETVEENRPFLDAGSMVFVRDESGRLIHEEVISQTIGRNGKNG